ncbi:hypothetical protein ACLB2K_047891 [Fragaria x ananassa]
METLNPTGVSMLLTIDTKRNRVLYAETSKEAVDFLFTLLSLPVATVISLLSGDGMVGLEDENQGEYVALSELIGLNNVEQADVFDENRRNEEEKGNTYGKYTALKKLRNTRTRRC